MMDFSWSEEQMAFKSEVVRFAQYELNDDAVERDRQSRFSAEKWQKCARFGLQGMPFPAGFGGGDRDVLTTMLAMEALGYGCRDNGLTFALNAQMWTVQFPLYHFGSQAQKEKYLPGLCRGELIAAHAITEPEAGSDVFSLTAHARKTEGGYVLNGRKQFITFAPIADLALIFATVDPAMGRWGISVFIVEKDTPGFRIGATRDKMGLRTVPMADLTLEDCFIPEENRLGPEGAGVGISNSSLEWERCFILASQVGAMEFQLESCLRYARERTQFGQAIGKFQSVSNRIADMKLRLETSRLLLYKVAWLKKMDKPATLEAALAKLLLSECFVQSSLDAVRIFGGQGYMWESDSQRDLRDAIGGLIYGGTSDIQRNIIAGLLGV